MSELHCFACGQQWPEACICARPDVKWQARITQLEADRDALVAMAREVKRHATVCGCSCSTLTGNLAREALSRIQGGSDA